MNAPARIDTPIPATREHELAVIAERIMDDFEAGRPLKALPKVKWDFYLTTDWYDAAVAWRDVAHEPQDASQALGAIDDMLTTESMWQGWMRLSVAEQEAWADCFENYASARNADRTYRTMEVMNLMVGQVCADLLSGVGK